MNPTNRMTGVAMSEQTTGTQNFLVLITRSNLTPGITRRAEPLQEFDKQRVRGRVHAVVRQRG